MKCARCLDVIKDNERWVSDPCCGAPDCEGLADVSHYSCLPVSLRVIEDDYDNWDTYSRYDDYEDYADEPDDDFLY